MTNLHFGFHKYKLQGKNFMEVEILYLKKYRRQSKQLQYQNDTWILIFKISKRS